MAQTLVDGHTLGYQKLLHGLGVQEVTSQFFKQCEDDSWVQGSDTIFTQPISLHSLKISVMSLPGPLARAGNLDNPR